MILRILFLIFLCGCQLKPTVLKEESTTPASEQEVLVDTRSELDFESYHISGSVSLRSEDFLILKNPKTQKRILDPDIPQTVERLAKRGITPLKKIILISQKKDSVENKKWTWLLNQLGIYKIETIGFDDYRKAHPKRIPQAPPEREPVWSVENVEQILKKSDQCFVGWIEKNCLN